MGMINEMATTETASTITETASTIKTTSTITETTFTTETASTTKAAATTNGRSLPLVPRRIPREKLPVGILGGTGLAAQRFIALLTEPTPHPLFRIALIGSTAPEAIGTRYGDLMRRSNACKLSGGHHAIPPEIADLVVQPCTLQAFSPANCRWVYSLLDSSVAGPVEEAFAAAGIAVFTSSTANRMRPDIPLIVPMANPHCFIPLRPADPAAAPFPPTHTGHGKKTNLIVAHANCTNAGIGIVLRALADAFGGVEAAMISTMQAISGAGISPGVSAMDTMDNVIPFIAEEEEKISAELRKMMGGYVISGNMAGDTTVGVDTIGGDTAGVDTIRVDTMGGDTRRVDTMGGNTIRVDTIGGDTIRVDTIGGDTMRGNAMRGNGTTSAAARDTPANVTFPSLGEDQLRISSSCSRVPVLDGHMAVLSVKLGRAPESTAKVEQVLAAYDPLMSAMHMESSKAPSGQTCPASTADTADDSCRRRLVPSWPKRPIHVFEEGVQSDRPQPRLDRDTERGMAVVVGRVRRCAVLDIKLVVLTHNTILGTAGGSLLNAELAWATGIL